MKALRYVLLLSLGIIYFTQLSGQTDDIQLQRTSSGQVGLSSTDLVYQLSTAPITYGEIMKQQNTPDGRVAQLLNSIPDGQGGTNPAVAIYNPATQSLDWVLQIDISLITDLQVVEDGNGGFSIWICSMWGDLVKISSDGNVLESYQLSDLGGNRNGSASSAGGYNYAIMNMAWSMVNANMLYLAVRTFSVNDDGYGLMLLAVNITTGLIIQHALAFTLAGSGYVSNYPGYEIRGLVIGNNGNLWLIAYDNGSHRMAFLNFSPALLLLAGYSSPYFYLDFFAYSIVNGYLLMAGSSLVTGCDNCATLAYMDFVNNPGIVLLYSFLDPGLASYIYREFTGIQPDCPETSKSTGSGCPLILSGHEYNMYAGVIYDPFLITIPDFTNISTGERKLVKNDTGLANGVTKTKSGVVMTYGSSGRYFIDEAPWLNLSLPGESNNCQSTETVSTVSQSWTLDNVNIEEDTGTHPAFNINTLIDQLINMYFSTSCSRNCDLTADFLIFGGSCAGSTLDFISTSYGNPGPEYYAWKFSDGVTLQGFNKSAVSRTFSDTGQYIVTLIVSDDFACVDSISDTFYICPNPIAGISAGDPDPCIKFGEKDTVVFTDVSGSNGCGQIVSRLWTVNGDTVGTGNSYTGVFTSYDTARITLIVETDFGCIDSTSILLEYGEGPEIKQILKIVMDSTPCEDITVGFAANVMAGSAPIVSYQWEFISFFGNQKIKENGNPVEVTFTESGIWDFILVVTDSNGCKDTLKGEYDAEIGLGPLALFNSNAPQCFDKLAGFTAVNFFDNSVAGSTAIVKWKWDFGDGSPLSHVQNPTHNFTAAGMYNVKLVVTDSSGCKDSITNKIQIYNGPSAGIDAPPYWCLGLPLHFKDKSIPGDAAIKTWSWTFGDGSVSNKQNPVHTYTNIGAGLNITLQVTDANGCSDQANDLLDIITVLASMTGDSKGCEGETLHFQASAQPAGNNYSWKWDFGDGGIATTQNSAHAFQKKGNYKVQVTATEPGGICADTATQNVTIYGNPDAYYAADTFCALLDSVLFSDSSYADPGNPINAWIWYFADDTLQGNDVYYSPNDSAEHQWITLSVNTVHNCHDSYSDSVEFVVDSLIDAGFSALINKMQVTFTDTSRNAIRHDWGFGDGSSAEDSARSIDHQYTAAGTYKVRLISYSYCDKDTVYKDVVIVPSGILTGPQGNYEIAIQPNPNNGRFNLLMKSRKHGEANIALYDLNGRLLFNRKEEISKTVEFWEINLSGESKGLYLLRVSGPDGNVSRLVIYQ